jgi:5-methylcytosine-specific restriction endonuclease McrA
VRLDIHHIDETKDNHHPDNLRALCRQCHKRVHAGLIPTDEAAPR